MSFLILATARGETKSFITIDKHTYRCVTQITLSEYSERGQTKNFIENVIWHLDEANIKASVEEHTLNQGFQNINEISYTVNFLQSEIMRALIIIIIKKQDTIDDS